MQFSKKPKNFVQLILFSMALLTVSPFILVKLNFIGTAHAETVDTTHTVSSTSFNGPVSYADAVALAAPAVVSINTSQEVAVDSNPLMQDPFFQYFFGIPNGGDSGDNNIDPRQNNRQSKTPPKELLQGLGSGVIVNDKGFILTNNHVIKDADTVVVTLGDGRTADAKVIGTDPDTDLAVLQIKLDKLPVITMGNSKKLRPGDVVMAIGNPFGLDKTVTLGIVSATERTGTDLGILETLIQTDAAINPGNSGGALIDPFGHLVGINTAIYTRSGGNQGIGFAIPIDQATDVMNQLIEGKTIVRGYLGIMMQPLNKEIRDFINYKDDGIYVRAVVQGSAAQKAGILPGDVIVKINNTALKDVRFALKLVADLKPKQSYPIEIFRKGSYINFTIIPTDRKQATQEKQ